MKQLYVLILIIAAITFGSIEVSAQPKECPKLNEIEKTSIKDKKEVLKALETLVSKTYEVGEYPNIYSEWNVITATPFPMTVGKKEDEIYYGMAKNFCGKEVANKSWLVRLHFPKSKGVSSSEGQIFLAKNKEKGWFVWFRYH